MTALGYVNIELLARVGDGEPHSLGEIQVPLTLKSVSTGTLEANLHDALEHVGVALQQVFTEEKE